MSYSENLIGIGMFVSILLLYKNGIISSQETIFLSILIVCYGIANGVIDLIKENEVVEE